MMRAWAIASLVAWITLLAATLGSTSNIAHAASAGDGAPATAPRLEQRRDEPQTTVKAIEPTVMCPSCDATLDQSDSPAAERMRVWIAAAVQAGWTKDEIRDGLVKEYDGDESVLAVPRTDSVGLGAWVAPLAIVLAIALTAFIVPRRWRRDAQARSKYESSSSASQSPPSSE